MMINKFELVNFGCFKHHVMAGVEGCCFRVEDEFVLVYGNELKLRPAELELDELFPSIKLFRLLVGGSGR